MGDLRAVPVRILRVRVPAIGATISPILGRVDPPWEPLFAVFFWFGLLLFAVVRYAGRRPSTG